MKKGDTLICTYTHPAFGLEVGKEYIHDGYSEQLGTQFIYLVGRDELITPAKGVEQRIAFRFDYFKPKENV